jgi:hypothetical protein
MLALKSAAIHEYDSSRAKSLDPFLGVYLFRTPSDLISPTTGPGYQYLVQQTDEVVRCVTMIKAALATITGGNEYRVSDTWYLLQTNEAWIDNPIHQHLTAEWVACVYINTNPGDSIEFVDEAGVGAELFPVPGTIFVFPATAKHRPMPTTGADYRISMNMEFALA